MRARLKGALDRRYAFASTVRAQQQKLQEIDERQYRMDAELDRLRTQVADGNRELRSMLSELQARVAELDTHLTSASASAETGRVDHARRLAEAERLVHECAGSIERLLQADVILRRDIDAIGAENGTALG